MKPKSFATTDETALRLEEFRKLALLRSTELSDWAIQVAHCAGDGRWDAAAKALGSASLTMNQLAGLVAQLLPTEKDREP